MTNQTERDVYKENYELKKQVREMQDAFSDILGHIYCIGGPLNDNVRQYNKNQLKPFSYIATIAQMYERSCDE